MLNREMEVKILREAVTVIDIAVYHKSEDLPDVCARNTAAPGGLLFALA